MKRYSDMEGVIRMATLADLDAVAALEGLCFPVAEAATKESFQSRLAVYPGHFWLLEQNGMLVSFVNGMATNEPDLKDEMYENAALHDPDGRWQMIFGVNTHPDHRRRGHAERVLRRVIADAKAQGRDGLVLTCKDGLVHYYAKLGFRDEGVSDSAHGGVVWHQMRLKF